MGCTRQGLIYENGAFHPEQRSVVRETIWHITVNGREAGSFACSPVQMNDAAMGWLFLGGWICAAEQVEQLEIREDVHRLEARVQEHTGDRPSARPMHLSAAEVEALLSRLEDRREKGVHSCALIRGEQIVFRSDVSRSAAVDKAAGACLRAGIPTEESVLVFSGRVPEGIVRKCVQMGCRIILARSGPTDLACEIAQEAGITIVGHAGPGRFCVYTCPERIE